MLAILLWFAAAASPATVDWPAYGNDPGGTRYSAAAQINTSNVSNLQTAWTYATKDMFDGGARKRRPSVLETTPIYYGGVLYLTSSLGRVIALDPETAKELWTFDPKINVEAGWGDFTNRGVALHQKGGKVTILAVSIDARLFALDGKTGERLWQVDLREGLRIPPREVADYEETSPPCVVNDVVVVGSAVSDNGRTQMPSGEVRGFDIATGKKLWTWDPVPSILPQDKAPGGANAWSVITADPKRNHVYVPTGSPSPDYYGGMRKEFNHGNSAVALDARTGKVAWSFQTVRHDLWDYDVASPPALVRVKNKDAVAVGSKTGHLFLLDRDTGKPLFPVEDRKVPASDADGEEAATMQPFPVLPKPLSKQQFEVWGPTPEARKWCEETISKLRNEGIFTPPSPRGSLLIPGNVGGLHWGGVTWDKGNKLIIAPANNLAAIARLIPRSDFEGQRTSDRLGLEWAPQSGTPYGMARQILRSPVGAPCNAPPWGTLTAIDSDTGEQKWQVPLGEFAGTPGSPNLGGPISTAGNLTFIGASFDGMFRAFDSRTGKELWKTKLPTSARSTPMTFVHKGKQYVVISAGGHDPKLTGLGDKVVAFALP
ncbi:MAG TPA: pyrroloquinoline quinone-dependent dehydrogenase [Bryobacteraceae bacterium]|nr:pyrroloquinoline quinone-dependent dehydrogenase [Bryobacteraceae bacterium]